jgi:hypothetical protein
MQRRITARTEGHDEPTTWQTRQAQYDAVCAWGIPDHGRLQRVSAIDKPVFVANGDSDPMIPPGQSHLIAGMIPQSQAKIYRDSAHRFLSSTALISPPTSKRSSARRSSNPPPWC